MKAQLTPVLLTLGLASAAHAAVPAKIQTEIQNKLAPLAPMIELSAEEVLSLPSANRIAVAAKHAETLIPQLEKLAFEKDRDYADRWKAVVLHAQLAGPEAQTLLSKSLGSSEWFMRNAALLAYQEVMPGRAANVARGLLTDKALVVRSAAIQVLEKHLDAEIREVLWGEIDQPRNFRKKQSLWTRPQILEILSKSPQERELPLYLAGLRDKDNRMHAPAIRALEKLTKQRLGEPKKDVAAKRELWLKWAKASVATRDL